MRSKIKIMLFLMAFGALTFSNAQEKTSEFEVLGNCNGCKKRIEKAAKGVTGVIEANWDKETKVVNIKVSDESTTRDMVSEAISGVGHDTEFHKAEASIYNDLPGCCQYDRVQ